MTDEDGQLMQDILATAQRAEAAAARAEGAALRAAESTGEMLRLLTEEEEDVLEAPQQTLEGEAAGSARDPSQSLDE